MPRKATSITRKCRYCGGPHAVSERVAEENPFCNACLPERVSRRAQNIGDVEIVTWGDYLMVRPRRPGMPEPMLS
jgi:hypothetical protein